MSLSLLQRTLASVSLTSSLASAAFAGCSRTTARLQSTQAQKHIEDAWNRSEQTSLTSKKTGSHLYSHEIHTPAERWSLASSMFMDRAVQPGNTYSGRSVEVSDGDVGHAFRRLDAIMNKNNVWAELRKTARHERKGEKRRRLQSERWRRRFKEEVRKRVQMVLEIRRRGA